jgi:hypothetical protein
VALTLAGLIFVLAVLIGGESISTARTPEDMYLGTSLLLGFAGALVVAILGRGARYIFADE